MSHAEGSMLAGNTQLTTAIRAKINDFGAGFGRAFSTQNIFRLHLEDERLRRSDHDQRNLTRLERGRGRRRCRLSCGLALLSGIEVLGAFFRSRRLRLIPQRRTTLGADKFPLVLGVLAVGANNHLDETSSAIGNVNLKVVR